MEDQEAPQSAEGEAKVVTLCGSTRFEAEFAEVNQRLTMEGCVVVSLGMFSLPDLPDYDWTADSADLRGRLSGVHLQKIRMADEVYIVDPGGYVGESTQREIAYAESLGKPVRYLSRERLARTGDGPVARVNPGGGGSEAPLGCPPMPSIKQLQVTFDCTEPERVARFWCEVLGYVVPPAPEEFATWDDFMRSLPPEEQGSWFACVDPSGVGPRLYFQRVPEGKVAKNRVHLDVRVGTGLVGEERLAALEAECARLVPLGATRVRLLYDGTDSCIVMQDIEGNEFCLD